MGVEEVVSGSIILSHTTIATGSAQLFVDVTPAAFGTRLTALADLYRLYRFVRLEGVFCRTATAANHIMVGYTAGNAASATAPTSFQPISEMDRVAVSIAGNQQHVKFSLSRRELAGELDWYMTDSGAQQETLLNTQGSIAITTAAGNLSAAADTVVIMWRYKVELAGRLTAAVSLERLKALVAEDSDDEKVPAPKEEKRLQSLRSPRSGVGVYDPSKRV